MVVDPNRLEVERIRNLTQGFGWELVKEEYTDQNIIIVLQKTKVISPVPTPGAS